MKEEKFPNTRKPSHRRVCKEFWNLGGQQNQEGEKKEPTDNVPSCDFQQRGSLDTCVRQQWTGAGQGGAGCLLRVGTSPECPEDNLRELMWDSNPNCGIAREREKKKERERERTFPRKALRHSLVTQNKGSSEYQRRVSRLWTGPSPGWRQIAGGQ